MQMIIQQIFKKTISVIFTLVISVHIYSQDTITSVDMKYKITEKGKKAFNSKTNKIFTGYLAEYDKGKILFISYYLEGELKESKDYYSNGNLLRIQHYKNGLEAGNYIEWDENGKVKIEGDFLEGMRDGFWSNYENGKLKSIGTYKYGIKDGIWKYFDENTNVIKKEFYINGVPQ